MGTMAAMMPCVLDRESAASTKEACYHHPSVPGTDGRPIPRRWTVAPSARTRALARAIADGVRLGVGNGVIAALAHRLLRRTGSAETLETDDDAEERRAQLESIYLLATAPEPLSG